MNTTNPNDDEIIIEVRAIRERLAARYDFDLDRIFEAAMRRQETSPGPFVEPAPKLLEVAKANSCVINDGRNPPA